MGKSESDYKSAFVKAVKAQGGWGRRVEDQYGVGILDMILVVPGLPVYFAEGKLASKTYMEPTPRQAIEMERINAASHGVAESLLIGFSEAGVYLSPNTERVALKDAFFCAWGTPERQMLEFYYKWRQRNG